jgi:hypothetical protein
MARNSDGAAELARISHHGWTGLPQGRGFSPAEIAAPALCVSRAPHSPDVSGLCGARDTGIIRKAFCRRG